MTKANLKKIGIEVWSYFAEYGECRNKTDLPEKLFAKIENLLNWCPFCEWFLKGHGGCNACPLINCFYDNDKLLFNRWLFAKTPKIRAKYAAKIRDAFINW